MNSAKTSSENRRAIVVSQSHYASANGCRDYSSSSGSEVQRRRQNAASRTGWNCPQNQPYAPFGELANVFKGCPLVRKRFQKFDLDISVPEQTRGCKFLEGKDHLMDFVMQEQDMSMATTAFTESAAAQPPAGRRRQLGMTQKQKEGSWVARRTSASV